MKIQTVLGILAIALGSVIFTRGFFEAAPRFSIESDRESIELSPSNVGLIAEPEVFEISSSASAERRRIVVRLRNDSRETVKILAVNSSCGCTVTDDLPAEPIQPGHVAQFPVVVSPQQFGTKQIMLTINTDSALTPIVQVKITVRGNSIRPPFVAAAPSQIRLIGHKPNEKIDQEFAIQSVESHGDPPWIQEIQSSDPSIVCTLLRPPEVEAPVAGLIRRTYQFRVCGDLSDRQMIATPLTIISSSPSTRPLMPIWVNLSLEPTIRVMPSVLTLRTSSTEAAIQREVLLVTESMPSWNCKLDDENLPLGITVSSVSNETDGKVRRFRVTIDENGINSLRSSADHRAILRFETDIESHSLVEIPLVLLDESNMQSDVAP